jgi:hypothetical protein
MKMRKNLLAMLLAVVMIAAVVFIAAPTAKADVTVTTAADNGVEIAVSANGTIVDLAGKTNVKITVTGSEDEENPVEIAIIDTSLVSATKADGSPDLSGENPGTAIISGTGHYKVKDWEQYSGYKYLKVENKGEDGLPNGTYSFHPFNISITKYGVNTAYSAVSIRVTVIANDVVAKLIDAGEFGMHNYSLKDHKDPEKAAKEYSPYWKSFKDFTNEEGKYTTHGIHGYFYLEDSLTSDVLTDNLFAQVGAYIKIGNLTVESNTKVDIYPKTILTDLNNKVIDEPTLFSEDQKAKMVELLNKEGNDYLKAYCGNFLPAEPVYVWELVKDASALKVGDKIVIVAMGSNYALSTTQNNNNRAQAAVTKDGNIITFGDDVQILTLETGAVENTFAFNTGSGYLSATGANSSNHLKTKEALDDDGSWTITIAADGIATIKAQNNEERNWLRYNSTNNPPIFSCYGSGQADVAIYKSVVFCDHEYDNGVVTAPTCGTAGYITKTCTICDNKIVEPGEAATNEHSYDNGVVTAPTCTKEGYTTYTCVDCGFSYTDNEVAANGHNNTSVVKDPTCNAGGYTTTTCSICGHSEVSDYTDPTGDHSFENGICSVCGMKENVSYNTESMNIFATTGALATDKLTITWAGENFTATGNKGTSSTAIRITDSDHFRVYAGSTFTIAGNNGAQISKIVITCVSGYVPTFTAQDGVTYETDGTTITVRLATPVDSITLSASAQWRLSKIEVTSTPPCEHEYGEGVVTDPTCTEEGYTTYTCTICGGSYKDNETEATGHTYVDGVCSCGAKEDSGEGETTEPTVVLEITKDDFNSTSYAANNNTKTENGYSYTSYQVMNQSSTMQWQSKKGYITLSSDSFVKLEIKVTAGTYTVTVDGKTVTGTNTNGVTTYDLSGLTGQVKIAVGSATGKTEYIKFYN